MHLTRSIVCAALFLGCTRPSPPPAASPLDVPPLHASAPAATEGHAFRYDLVLSIADGPDAAEQKLSLDVSDTTPGDVTFGKNAPTGTLGARADVGTRLKARITMDGTTPRLELEAQITTLDAEKRVARTSAHGMAATPLGTTTTVLETTEGGRRYRIDATPAAQRSVGASAPPGAWAVDVTCTQSGTVSKTTRFTLGIDGAATAMAREHESVPLQAGGGGFSPRQDVGVRVKATPRTHASGLDVDFDLEWSALESAGAFATIRRIHASGPMTWPLDRPSTAFRAEENGQRYEVVVTPRRR